MFAREDSRKMHVDFGEIMTDKPKAASDLEAAKTYAYKCHCEDMELPTPQEAFLEGLAHEREASRLLGEAVDYLSQFWFNDHDDLKEFGCGSACSTCDMGDAGEPVDERGHDMTCTTGMCARELAAYRQKIGDSK